VLSARAILAGSSQVTPTLGCPVRLDVYSPFMIENQCELAAIVDNVQAPKPVAAQRVTATNGNPREQSAAKAGVAGSNPAGGTHMVCLRSSALRPRTPMK
jgi:hypothetical protein